MPACGSPGTDDTTRAPAPPHRKDVPALVSGPDLGRHEPRKRTPKIYAHARNDKQPPKSPPKSPKKKKKKRVKKGPPAAKRAKHITFIANTG